MKAGDQANWLDRETREVKMPVKIIAIYTIDDAINKKIIGKKVCRIEYAPQKDIDIFADELEEIKPIE